MIMGFVRSFLLTLLGLVFTAVGWLCPSCGNFIPDPVVYDKEEVKDGTA